MLRACHFSSLESTFHAASASKETVASYARSRRGNYNVPIEPLKNYDLLTVNGSSYNPACWLLPWQVTFTHCTRRRRRWKGGKEEKKKRRRRNDRKEGERERGADKDVYIYMRWWNCTCASKVLLRRFYIWLKLIVSKRLIAMENWFYLLRIPCSCFLLSLSRGRFFEDAIMSRLTV